MENEDKILYVVSTQSLSPTQEAAMTENVNTIAEKDWQWFGHAGHFICSQWCRFHLCTKVGGFLVSTVGEYVPDEPLREIHCRVHRIELTGKGDARLADYMQKVGYQEIGSGRTYETMVFRAGDICTRPDCDCGLPEIASGELWFQGYNNAGDATRGHMAACERATRADFESTD